MLLIDINRYSRNIGAYFGFSKMVLQVTFGTDCNAPIQSKNYNKSPLLVMSALGRAF
jgi:hypothetical protein